jgi:hypothetical protein
MKFSKRHLIFLFGYVVGHPEDQQVVQVPLLIGIIAGLVRD